MVQVLEELKYTNDHEWAHVKGDVLVMGITDYAQDLLGEIVYIELPSEGDEITKGDPFGAVESTKAVSDLYAPVSGDVVEVNEALLDSPELINTDPYGEGWIVRLQPAGEIDESGLMSPDDYQALLDEQDD
jgi:glycine cleavage system H protein